MKKLAVVVVVILALAVGGGVYFKYFRAGSSPTADKTQNKIEVSASPSALKGAASKDSTSKDGTSKDTTSKDGTASKDGAASKGSTSVVSDIKVEAAFGKAEGKAGDTVEVPVSFKGVPSVGLDGCDFVVGYDKNSLEPAGVEPGDIIPQTTDFGSSNPQEGKIKLAFLSDKETLKKDGVFAKLKFKIKSDAKPGNAFIKLDSVGAFVIVEKDVEEINSQFTDGSVTIH